MNDGSSVDFGAVVVCELCGRRPTQHFTFRQVTGMVLANRISTIEGQLCRECAQRAGRELQSATLLTGWWGIIAVFRNIGAVFTNASGLSRAASMPEPHGGALSFIKDEPVLRRPKSWLGIAAIGAVVAIGVGIIATEEQTPSTNRTPTFNQPANNQPAPERQADWSVGSCVSGYTSLLPVPCSQPHSGKIVGSATTSNSCPASADGFVDHLGGVLCIDSNL